MQSLSVTVDVDAVDDELFIKFACDIYELNVTIPKVAADQLQRVPTTKWITGALCLGQSAGASVFWSCDDGLVSLLVGDDDQTWDIAITIPLEAFNEVLEKVSN